MPVGNLLEDIHTEPLAEFHHTFLVARGAKMPSFTRKRQQVFVAAVFTFDAGKTIVQIAAIEITIDSPRSITESCLRSGAFAC